MSREILFRGKRKDNGEWVEGGLHKWETRQPCALGDDILQQDEIKYMIIVNSFADWNMPRTMQAVEVIPETVGEYIGLRDKNDKRIFEGDIVKTKKYGKVIGHSNVNDYDIFQIVYEPAVFRLTNNHRGFNFVGNPNDYEVISNIHDNPELLEV